MSDDTPRVTSFVWVQISLSVLAISCSTFIVALLAPQKPWRSSNLRVRATLVLSIAMADWCYSIVHLTSAVLYFKGIGSQADEEYLCPILGPFLYFSIFIVYISIANLSHYSFYRINMRETERVSLLGRYILVLVGLSIAFTVVVWVVGRFFRDEGTSTGGFRLSHGYCVATQPGFLHYTDISFFITLFVALWMGCKARAQHPASVFYRHCSVVTGYMSVALCVGGFQLFEIIWRKIHDVYLPGQLDQVSDPVVCIYMAINLLWPVGNFIIFTLVAKQSLAEEEAHSLRGLSLTGRSRLRVKDVGFACEDSEGQTVKQLEKKDARIWRKSAQAQAKVMRFQIKKQLCPLVEQLVPSDVKDRGKFMYAAVTVILEDGGVEWTQRLIKGQSHDKNMNALRQKLGLLWGELCPDEAPLYESCDPESAPTDQWSLDNVPLSEYPDELLSECSSAEVTPQLEPHAPPCDPHGAPDLPNVGNGYYDTMGSMWRTSFSTSALGLDSGDETEDGSECEYHAYSES